MGADDRAEPVAAAAEAAEAAGVVVRELATLPELRALLVLYERIWGHSPIGLEQLRAITHAGNYAAGAYRGGELVGGCVGFFAAPPGQALHSHVAGVTGPGGGVGYALKLHQRGWALARGLTTVTWTFDPLVRRNAHFNLAKLAARPAEYLVDFYGELTDAINAGQGSDRLLVNWELAAPAVVAACQGRPLEPSPAGAVPALSIARSGQPRPGSGWQAAGRVLVAVPEDIEELRQREPGVARDWRRAVREVLGELMHGGARVTGFTRAAGYLVDRSGEWS